MNPLLIFDCDGVLVDSEILAIEVEVQLLGELGIAISPEAIASRYCGLSMPSMRRKIESEFGRSLPGDFEARSLERVTAVFDDRLRAIPGVAEAVLAISAPKCVASSSDLERIEHCLKLTDLHQHLHPHLFSAEMVNRGKPAPDLFLYAAEQMGVEPANCIVIEDSRPGVTAAVAANMRVLGFAGGSHCLEGHERELLEAGALRVFRDMAELPELVPVLT